jgi:glycosyltransferase involved in cell wall biosynthesis
MRIGIICPNFPPATFEGGIAHYSEILARQLAKRGHEVIGIGSTEYARDPEKAAYNPKIERIRIAGPWDWKSVFKIRKLSVDLALDCMILQFSPALYKKTFRLMWAKTSFKCQKITSFHTLWGKGLDRLFGILFLIGSRKIIATNSEIVSIIERRLPFLLKKTYWIPIGSNIISRHPVKVEKPNPVPTISYFGMLYPGKGLDLILDVLKTLKGQGHQFNFKFIGGPFKDYEFYESDFRKKIKYRALDDCVEHLGRVDNDVVSNWLYKSRFVFLPYKSGLSDRRGSFMAAIAHQKAVLTSAPVVPMQSIKNRDNALWPEEYTVGAFAKLAEHLLSDDKMIARLEQGAKKLSSFFDWGKIAFEYECALHE